MWYDKLDRIWSVVNKTPACGCDYRGQKGLSGLLVLQVKIWFHINVNSVIWSAESSTSLKVCLKFVIMNEHYVRIYHQQSEKFA